MQYKIFSKLAFTYSKKNFSNLSTKFSSKNIQNESPKQNNNLKTLIFPQKSKAAFIHSVEKKSLQEPYSQWQKISKILAKDLIAALNLEVSFPNNDSAELLEIIKAASRENILPEAILVNNFPVDPKENLLPNAPHDENYNYLNSNDIGKKGYIAEYALLAIFEAMNLNFATNHALQNGWPYQHVSIKKNKENTASHAGKATFPRHSDGAHNEDDKLIDVVALLTLRNGNTNSILVKHAVLEEALKEKLGNKFAILEQPNFIFNASKAYDQKEEKIAPIIQNVNGKKKWRVQGNRDLIRVVNSNDQEVLNIFLDTLENLEPTHKFPLKYSDLMLIDNLSGYVHARSPIDTSNAEDAERHLLRSMGRFKSKPLTFFSKPINNEIEKQWKECNQTKKI